ncbi:MAG: aldehyde ferredoxin oxidoreductase N-terminal domain-containing protein [Anaerolineae bacterium]
MKRRILLLDAAAERYHLETHRVETLPHDEREDYFTLHGEALCQYLLRRDPASLVIARGPMAFLAGNKATVGYLSPLTGVPHYSFVGGRAAAQLYNLDLDAILLTGTASAGIYVVLSGRAPSLQVDYHSSDGLPSGQRAAFYHLVEAELGGDAEAGSVLTLGEGALHGYLAANLAVDGLYHAGRGGAGQVFVRHLRAMVLRGEPLDQGRFFATTGADPAFARSPNRAIADRLATYTARLSGQTGGTVVKLYDTGSLQGRQRTLPAHNARQMGTELAELGRGRLLAATRDGHTGCHWCPVDCRHWHWVEAEYAPGGRDRFLDDFEPTYATFAMLGLQPEKDSLEAAIALWREVNRRLILPIEQMGCDVIDTGVGLAALFEGLQRGLIPREDVPAALAEQLLDGDRATSAAGRLNAAVAALDLLRRGIDGDRHPALRAIGDGPQALAARYPAAQEIVFTCGRGTMANAGHSNALWTFLMPFSRFFGHYSGQIYKIDEQLPTDPDDEALRRTFERVVCRMLDREAFGILCNALSCCAFTFVLFSQEGEGERLDDTNLLVHTLQQYGIHTSHEDLSWFAEAFWAQSIDLKAQHGWRPPSAADLPRRVYEGLELVLEQPVAELMRWMDMLIEVWVDHARERLHKFGYDAKWLG